MTALSIPVALAVALHCAPAEDPGMMVGIAQQESGLEPLTLRDNNSGQVLRGAGVIESARRLIYAGHSVDLGAWQINSRNLALLGLGIADAFEPCKSVSAQPGCSNCSADTALAARRGGSRTATPQRLWPQYTR